MAEFWKKLNLGFLSSVSEKSGFVALDIGSSSIKLVETAIDKSGYRVLKLGILPLPANAIQNNMVVDAGSVVETIQELIRENGVKSTQAISAVPGRAVIMKKIQLPMQEESELEANIEFEANNVIPESLENVNLDYQVLNYLDGGSRMEVLVVAVKKEIVNSYTEAIEEAGLKPALMDVDYFAMENMYEANYPAEESAGVVGLIHVGSRYTSINLLHNGLSTFTGDLPMGGDEYTDSLKRELNLSSEAAETLKVTGLLDGKKGLDIAAMLRASSENLAEEIRRTLTLYGSVPSEEGGGLKMIYMSGGSAKVPGLREILEERMAVPVRLAEPFRGFTVAKEIDRDFLAEAAPAFAVGAGLSIRRPGDK
jgi:type IV pilus assembly protein PilM